MIAVTGASGYIGRAVILELSRLGLPVVAVSRSGCAHAHSALQWRITDHSFPSAATFVDCDTVIHLAGRAHTTVVYANGQDLFDLENRELALATAEAAHAAGVNRFVFVSTLGVHGIGSELPLRADSPIQPDLPYARSKWSAEQQLSSWCKSRGMALCIVRPPMVYGPSCPGSFSRLVRLVRRGMPLPFSALHAQRSFIYVDNLASFLVECAQQEVTGTYLVSDGSDWSVKQLVLAIGSELQLPVSTFPVPVVLLRLLGTLTGKQREVDSLTLPMRVDTEPARRDFGWLPRVAPQEALRLSVRDHAV